jgi:hypothetical protein
MFPLLPLGLRCNSFRSGRGGPCGGEVLVPGSRRRVTGSLIPVPSGCRSRPMRSATRRRCAVSSRPRPVAARAIPGPPGTDRVRGGSPRSR